MCKKKKKKTTEQSAAFCKDGRINRLRDRFPIVSISLTVSPVVYVLSPFYRNVSSRTRIDSCTTFIQASFMRNTHSYSEYDFSWVGSFPFERLRFMSLVRYGVLLEGEKKTIARLRSPLYNLIWIQHFKNNMRYIYIHIHVLLEASNLVQ